MIRKIIIWDFDGTLVYRMGGFVEALLVCVLDMYPGYPADADDIRVFLSNRYPWSTPEKPHTHIKTADEWWESLHPVFERACLGIGLDHGIAHTIARTIRDVYLDLKYWRLFEDSEETLRVMRSRGWSQVIFTNHVPEIDSVIDSLGLTTYMDRVFNSAYLGYEKPHPLAFKSVLESLGTDSLKWMVGDNVEADVRGAEAAGIPCILVRKQNAGAAHFAARLSDVPDMLEKIEHGEK